MIRQSGLSSPLYAQPLQVGILNDSCETRRRGGLENLDRRWFRPQDLQKSLKGRQSGREKKDNARTSENENTVYGPYIVKDPRFRTTLGKYPANVVSENIDRTLVNLSR